MPDNTPLIRPTDAQAIELAKSLINNAEYGALGVFHPDTQTPFVTRIALGTTAKGQMISLVSSLSVHTQALLQNPECSLLVGEPGAKGDPLTHPRLTLQCRAEFLPRTHAGFAQTRADYLASHPKSKLYIDFADFGFVLFRLHQAALKGGFGKAFVLTKKDLEIQGPDSR